MNMLALLFTEKPSHASGQWMVFLGVAMAVMTMWVSSVILFGFSLPLYILFVLILAAVIFAVPGTGLPIIILSTMWFQRWFTLEPIVLGDVVYKLYPLDVVFLLTILAFIFHQAFGKERFHLPIHRLESMFLVFFFTCVLYLARSFLDGQADQALAVSAFKNYAFYGMLYFLIIYSVRSLVELKRLLKVLLVGGFGIIGFIFIGIIRGEGLWTEFNPLSTEGVRLLSFPHAFYLSFVLVLTLVLFVYRLRPERVTVLTMWIQLIGLLGSLMRHLWISVFLVTAFLFVVVPKTVKAATARFFAKNVALLTLAGTFVAFVVILFPLSDASLTVRDFTQPVYQRARSLARSTADSSARWRIFAWRAARESFTEHALFGVGYGQDLTIDFETYRVVVPIRDLHNSLLVLLVQMGMLGFGIFLASLIMIGVRFFDAWKRRGMYWPYQLALFGAWLVFVAASFWQPYFETNFTGIFFWILLGFLMVSLRLDDENVNLTGLQQPYARP